MLCKRLYLAILTATGSAAVTSVHDDYTSLLYPDVDLNQFTTFGFEDVEKVYFPGNMTALPVNDTATGLSVTNGSSSVGKRFDFFYGVTGVAGYIATTGYQDVDTIMGGCFGVLDAGTFRGRACLPPIMKFTAGNVLYFMGGGSAADVVTALNEFKDSTIKAIRNRDELKRSNGELTVADLGYNVPDEFKDRLRVEGSILSNSSALDKRGCGYDSHFRRDRGWFDFDAPQKGFKVMCKASCNTRYIDWDSYNILMEAAGSLFDDYNALSIQFTLYNKNDRTTSLRCKAVLIGGGADNCEEEITGHGCAF